MKTNLKGDFIMYNKNNMKRFVKYLRRTRKQKLYAVGMIAVGVLSALIADGDITLLVVTLLFAIPMFISNKIWIS
jgi:uncharacterized membrane protein YiaA